MNNADSQNAYTKGKDFEYESTGNQSLGPVNIDNTL